ncbi:MAG TPA: DUF2997 domain-containing protein [Methanocella sp.]|nr:DUF2997 domain-containing protein [Methanocella sp.]
MTMQELEVNIDREGNVTVKVKGVKGTGCTELTKALEESLGDVRDRKFASEYYEKPREVRRTDKIR